MYAGLIRIVLWALALLPLRLNHALGAGLGWATAILPGRMRRITERNLVLCFPHADCVWRRRYTHLSLMETGKAFTEAPYLWRSPKQRIHQLIRETTQTHVLDAALKQGRGVIVAVPHLGCWEILGMYLATVMPTTFLYRPPKLKALDEAIRRGREHVGGQAVPATAGGLRALFKALRQGECIGILPDQVPALGQGVFAPFFGHSAYTMGLISRLAARHCTPVVLAYAERLPRARGYRLHFRAPPAKLSTGTVEEGAALLNLGIMRLVLERPEQYLWSYKRFKRQPPGMASPY